MRLSEALETFRDEPVQIYFSEDMEQVDGNGGFVAKVMNDAVLNKIVKDISGSEYGYSIRVEG
jgi:hypothetical protein